ncbi:MAG: sodium:calcium antiporter [Vicinamibacterales bacterium]
MGLIDFQSLPVAGNLAIFAVAAGLVWLAGGRLAGYADAVSERTQMGQALIGMLLLGVATSLPEMVTTISGSILGNAPLVTGNLFGGVAMQITVLAVVDVIAVRGALTYVTPHPILLFQGVMLILMLAVALAGAAIGEPLAYLGVGLTPLLLGAMYVLTLRAANSREYLPRWQPVDRNRHAVDEEMPDEPVAGTAGRLLWVRIALAAVVIMAAGAALTLTGDALAEQTGLGASFVGVALVSASTSLPELSTTLESVRRGNVEMAVSNILGTNLLEVALFLLADVTFRDGAILAATERSGMFAGSLGLVVTGVLLLGLLQRRDRTVARMGIDSLAILWIYGLGLVGLYFLR